MFGAVPLPDVASWLFWAMLVPPNAKKRNMKVPANSEAAARNSMRHLFAVFHELLAPCWPGLCFTLWDDAGDVSFWCSGSMFLSAMMERSLDFCIYREREEILQRSSCR